MSLIGHVFSLLKVAVMCIILLLEGPAGDLFKFSWALFLKIGIFLIYHIREKWKIPRYNQRYHWRQNWRSLIFREKQEMHEIPLSIDAYTACSLLHLNNTTTQNKDCSKGPSVRDCEVIHENSIKTTRATSTAIKNKALWVHVIPNLCFNKYCDFLNFFSLFNLNS